MEFLPSSLISSVNFVSAFERNTLKITPDRTDASPNETTNFEFKDAGIWDLSTFAVHGTATIATADSQMPFSENLINTLKVHAGSDVIDYITEYGQLNQMMSNALLSKTQCNEMSIYSTAPLVKPYLIDVVAGGGATDAVREAGETGLENVAGNTGFVAPTTITGNAAAASATNLPTNTTDDRATIVGELVTILNAIGGEVKARADVVFAETVTNINAWKETLTVEPRLIAPTIADTGSASFVISKWYGFMGSLNVPFLDLTKWPHMMLELNWAPNTILGSGTGTYELSGLYATVVAYELPAYGNMVMQALQKGPMQLVFDRFITSTFSTAAGQAGDHKWKVHSQAIRRIWWTWQANAYRTQAVVAAGMHTPNYFVHANGNASTMTEVQLYVDGIPVPRNPITDANAAGGYYRALSEIGVVKEPGFDNLVYSLNDWNIRKWFMVHSLDASSFAGNDSISGYNTGGVNAQLNLTHSDPAAQGRVVVFTQATALLNLMSEKMIQMTL
jgi:hypothetical protein